MKTVICLSVCVTLFFCTSGVVGGNAFRSFLPRVLVNSEDKICSPPFGDTCVDILKCKFFTELLDKSPIPRPRSIVRIIKEHQCGFEKNVPKVCCSKTSALGSSSRITTTTATATTTLASTPELKRVSKEPTFFDTLTDQIYDHPNYHLLPVDRCGPIPQSFRITSGKKTALEEFPWMALIAYRTEDIGIEFRCGGTLINKDYVLTAAHCILNSTLLGVRLGEYDLSSMKKDCDDDNDYCAPPVQDFYIDHTIIHPKYNPKTFAHDIALIRLSRSANFSSSIQPICLPVSDLNDDLTGKFAIVAGWGVTEDGHKSSILLKASVPVHNIQTCKKVYNDFAPITVNQICAGGYKGQDSCSGDSGGPLTYTGLVDGIPRYIQYGVVSYGPRECGSDGQPGIYTRVSKYLKWILDSIY